MNISFNALETPDEIKKIWKQTIAAGPDGLGQQVRAALSYARLVSLSSEISPTLLQAVLNAGAVSPSIALNLARQKRNPKQRIQCLIGLMEYISPTEFNAIMQEILKETFAVRNEMERMAILASIAAWLPADAMQVALEIVKTIKHDWMLGAALSVLVPYLPPQLLNIVAEMTRDLQDNHWRSTIFVVLLERIVEGERAAWLAEALQAARSIQTPGGFPFSLDQFINLSLGDTPPGARSSVPLRITHEGIRAQALHALLPYVSDAERVDLLAEALAEARSIIDAHRRVYALSQLAMEFPTDEREEVWRDAIAALSAFQSYGSRDRAFCYVASRLTLNASHDLFRSLLDAVRKVDHVDERARVLSAVLAWLPDSLVDDTLAIARALSDGKVRVYALLDVLTRLPKHRQMEVLNEALAAARAIEIDWLQVRALATIAMPRPKYQAEGPIANAVTIALSMRDVVMRGPSLEALAFALPEYLQKTLGIESLLPQMSVLAHELGGISFESAIQELATKLMNVVTQLPKSEEEHIVRQMTAVAHSPWNIGLTAYILNGDVLELSEQMRIEVLDEALTIARSISQKSVRIHTLLYLSGAIPDQEEHLLAEALEVARAIPATQQHERAAALSGLAVWLSNDLLQQALTIARRMTNPRWRAYASAMLADRLSSEEQEQVWEEAVRSACTIEKADMRRFTLDDIIAHSSNAISSDALKPALSSGSELGRVRVLSGIAARLPENEQNRLFNAALATANIIVSVGHRANALRLLAIRMPVTRLSEVLDKALSIRKAGARAEVMSALAQRLPNDLLDKVLKNARKMSDKVARVRVLSAISTRLPEVESDAIVLEAVQALGTLVNMKHILDGMRALPDKLSLDMLQKTLGVFLGIYMPESLKRSGRSTMAATEYSTLWIDILYEIVLRAPDDTPEIVLNDILAATRTIRDQGLQSAVLNAVIARLPDERRGELLSEALNATREIWWDLSLRVRRMCELTTWMSETDRAEKLIEILNIARTANTKHQDRRTVALGVVAGYLPESEQSSVFTEALTTIKSTRNKRKRAQSLTELLLMLPNSYLIECLRLLRSLSDQQEGVVGLVIVAERWSAMCNASDVSGFDELTSTLQAFAERGQAQLLAAIDVLLPVIEEQGRVEALREIARSVIEIDVQPV